MTRRRWPLWTTLLPLAAGLAVYWWYWDQQRAAFRAGIERVLGAETDIRVTGFPYRLEATLGTVALGRATPEWTAAMSADDAIVNRQPWRADPTIVRLREPRAELAVPAIAGARLNLAGSASQTSLRWDGERIARLSTEIEGARIRFALLGAPATASRFEIHFRETPAAADPASRAPTPPEQAQLVLAGDAVRLGSGDPLALAAQVGVTGPAALRTLSAWRPGGTVELRRLTLSDRTGEILVMTATLVPQADGRPRVSGTIDTVCPFTVEAAFAGRAPPAEERRARKPVRLAVGGTAGDFALVQPPGGLRPVPVRGQEPPCPAIRR